MRIISTGKHLLLPLLIGTQHSTGPTISIINTTSTKSFTMTMLWLQKLKYLPFNLVFFLPLTGWLCFQQWCKGLRKIIFLRTSLWSAPAVSLPCLGWCCLPSFSLGRTSVFLHRCPLSHLIYDMFPLHATPVWWTEVHSYWSLLATNSETSSSTPQHHEPRLARSNHFSLVLFWSEDLC